MPNFWDLQKNQQNLLRIPTWYWRPKGSRVWATCPLVCCSRHTSGTAPWTGTLSCTGRIQRSTPCCWQPVRWPAFPQPVRRELAFSWGSACWWRWRGWWCWSRGRYGGGWRVSLHSCSVWREVQWRTQKFSQQSLVCKDTV